MESLDIVFGACWCKNNGLKYKKILSFINLQCSPYAYDFELHPQALLLCEVLNKTPFKLWSKEQLTPLEINKSFAEVDYEEIKQLANLNNSYLTNFEAVENSKLIENQLKTLSDRQQEIIKLRFYEGRTLEYVGRIYNVSIPRVRQIEAKALRILSHPTKSKILREVYEQILQY